MVIVMQYDLLESGENNGNKIETHEMVLGIVVGNGTIMKTINLKAKNMLLYFRNIN